jgi:hypothetical protein
MGKGNNKKQSTGSALGFESTLWAAANKLRGNMDACAGQYHDANRREKADLKANG